MDLKGRNFLTLKDFTPEEIGYFLQLSKELKEKKKNGISHRMHEGKSIVYLINQLFISVEKTPTSSGGE